MSGHLHLAPALGTRASPDRADSPVRVVLADDNALARRHLRLLLAAEDDVDVVAEGSDLVSVARHAHGYAPHVLVLDLQMPGAASLEAIRRLRDRVPETEIVVLTTEDNPAFAQDAIEAGAIGFVLKDRVDTELPEATRRASRGEEYVSSQVAAGLDALRRTVDDDGLSPRETEVLRLIALGHTSAEIALKLHLSRRTIETHRASIHRKLGLDTRAELVRFALRRGLIAT
jgi:two-component system response regulator NreC